MNEMIEKPKRPDCNSCYHFNETEGYCRVCKKHINPKEGEECEQFEPHSLYCDTDSVDINSSYPSTLFDTRAIKPEKYAELREQDFDTWLDIILHEIIKQVNFDASEVDALGGAVWNGEFPDGTPYPKQCKREDAYIQCIRTSNRVDGFMKNVDITVNSLDERLSIIEEQVERIMKYIEKKETEHMCSNFCGNCAHYQAPTSSVTLPTCKLSGEVVDPDDSSCTMFEPPF